ncbi:MAG: alanyl-tRNA editing protein [Acidobacteriota bacterium]
MQVMPAYERDPYRTELEVAVVEAGEDTGRPFAVLDDTILYPEGGGQPADRGWLDEVAVVDVRRSGDAIRHHLERPVPPGPARLRLDWARRFDHMQQHTGQHLLTAVALERFGWRTTAFHLGADVSDIELDAPSLTRTQLSALEEAVAAQVRGARSVSARRVTPEEYATLAVRSRGLPEGFAGEIRLVEIKGVDLNTCGGTHLRSTAELEALALLGTEPMRGGTRVFFVAGGRLRRRMAAHEERNAALRAALDAPESDFVALVERRRGEARELERQVGTLLGDLAVLEADALAASPGILLEAHYEGRDASFLQTVARRVAPNLGGRVAFLTAAHERGHFFAVVAGERCPKALSSLGAVVADALGGRGGGAGRIFQGKASSFAARVSALDALLAALSGNG